MLSEALTRIEPVLAKILKKHKEGVIVVVVPKPLATLLQCHLDDTELADLWKAEQPCGSWTMIDVPAPVSAGLHRRRRWGNTPGIGTTM